MLRKCKGLLLSMTVIFLIIFLYFTSNTKFLKADCTVSKDYVLDSNIHIFSAGNDKYYILSNDNQNKSLISCFDSNSKTFVMKCEVPYLYDAYAYNGDSIYLAKNDLSKETITINQYFTCKGANKEYFDYDEFRVKGKTLLSSNAFEVDADGNMFIIDLYDNSEIFVMAEDDSTIDIGADMGPFSSIKTNFSGDTLYATTELNELVSFQIIDGDISQTISYHSVVPSNYKFIDDNLIVSNYGGLYEIDENTNTLDFLFNIEKINERNLVCKFGGNILLGSTEGQLILLDKENNEISNIFLNGEILDFCVNEKSAIVLTSVNGTKYIRIINEEDFLANSEVPEDNAETQEGDERPDDEQPSENTNDDMDDTGNTDDGLSNSITSSIYDINFSDFNITDVELGTTIAAFKKNIECPKYNLTFKNYSGKSITSGKLGTGATVTFSDGAGKSYMFTIIMPGDLTGEGNSNSRDLKLLSDYILGKGNLEGAYLKAADLNNDGEVNTIDLLILSKMINS